MAVRTLAAVAIAAALVFTTTTSAAARNTWIPIGSGEKIYHVAPLDEQARYELGPKYGPEYALGYVYETFVLLGLDVWTWNGGYCIYTQIPCDRVTATRAAEVLGVDASDLPVPWTYTFKPGLVLIVAVLAAWYVLAARRRRILDAQPSASDDPRYQRALELVMEGTKQLPLGEQAVAARRQFSAGVDYLVEQGIEREEASGVLVRLVDTVLDFRRRTASHK